MKKLTTLLLAAGLVVSSFAGVSSASAGEFKPNAQFINQYTWGTSGSAFTNQDDNFVPQFRLRLGFDYIASESLSGTFLFQVGAEDYGTTSRSQMDNSISGANNESGYNVRLAYVDWMIPTTDVSVRMGFQPISLPSFAFGSPVLDGRGTGITVAAPINENINLAAMWTRVQHDNGDGHNGSEHSNEYDAFAVIADFNYDGFRIAPWALFATKGDDAGLGINLYNTLPAIMNNGAALSGDSYDMTAWMIGASFELSMFDPFIFALDAYYSDADINDIYNGGSRVAQDQDMQGWYVGASASYKTMYGTPALKAWYASGNDKDEVANNSGSSFGLGQPMSLVGGFNATTIMFADQAMDTDDYGYRAYYTPAGTWGVVLEWADFSFVDKLSHTARIAYIEGTNDDQSTKDFVWYNGNNDMEVNALRYLTTDDNVVEVNFNSTYEIYKNFHAHLELGWLTADFGKRDNQSITDVLGKDADDDIFRSALSFVYKF